MKSAGHRGLVRRDAWVVARCAGKRVLHVGCTDHPITDSKIQTGSLLHLKLLAASGHIEGIDLDARGIQLLADRYRVPNLRVLNAEEMKPDDFGAPFDVVVACDVLEHMSNPGAFLGAAAGVLAPCGELLVTVPNAFSVKRFLFAAVRRQEHVHPDHVAYLSDSTLRELLGRYNWEIEELRYFMWENETVRNQLANGLLSRTLEATRRAALADELAVCARFVAGSSV